MFKISFRLELPINRTIITFCNKLLDGKKSGFTVDFSITVFSFFFFLLLSLAYLLNGISTHGLFNAELKLNCKWLFIIEENGERMVWLVLFV